MAKVKALVMTYRDYDLDTLAKAYFMNEELGKIYESHNSLVALETCNRVEFYLDGDADEEELIKLINGKAGIRPRVLYDLDAIKHLLLVTTGLDSMFLGEREILSQVKRAYGAGKPSTRLRILFESAIRFGESFRRRYNLYDISFVKFLSDYLMKHIDRSSRILVVGGGEVARGIVRELLRNNYNNVTIVNRSLDKIKYEFGDSVRLLGLNYLMNELMTSRYDTMIVAISTQNPLINSDAMDDHSLPSLIIDVSTPSAVKLQGNGHVRVIRLEELKEPYLEYVNGRSNIVEKLLEIEAEAGRIMRLIMRSDADAVIRDVMKFIEEIRMEEVREALSALSSGMDARTVIDAMSRSLIKRIMHNYLENMRRYAENGDNDTVEKLRSYLMMIKSGEDQ